MQKIEAKDSSQKEFRAGSVELQDTERACAACTELSI